MSKISTNPRISGQNGFQNRNFSPSNSNKNNFNNNYNYDYGNKNNTSDTNSNSSKCDPKFIIFIVSFSFIITIIIIIFIIKYYIKYKKMLNYLKSDEMEEISRNYFDYKLNQNLLLMNSAIINGKHSFTIFPLENFAFKILDTNEITLYGNILTKKHFRKIYFNTMLKYSIFRNELIIYEGRSLNKAECESYTNPHTVQFENNSNDKNENIFLENQIKKTNDNEIEESSTETTGSIFENIEYSKKKPGKSVPPKMRKLYEASFFKPIFINCFNDYMYVDFINTVKMVLFREQSLNSSEEYFFLINVLPDRIKLYSCIFKTDRLISEMCYDFSTERYNAYNILTYIFESECKKYDAQHIRSFSKNSINSGAKIYFAEK